MVIPISAQYRGHVLQFNITMHLERIYINSTSDQTLNIAYLHAPALGCPKPIRNQYKLDGNWKTYTRDFFEASWAGQR